MNYLVFQLDAMMASWGEPAVGESRGSSAVPSQSALLGLLGAALGIERDDEAAHDTLQRDFTFASGTLSAGDFLRDYQTAQVPSRSALKGRPSATRRQEMSVPKDDLGTILSTRDYRVDSHYLIAVQRRDEASGPYTLDALAQALQRPRYPLYVGRKSCPLAAPTWPQLIDAPDVKTAFDLYADRFKEKTNQAAQEATRENSFVMPTSLPRLTRLSFHPAMQAGVAHDLVVRRKDHVIRRNGWQFGDRDEWVAMLNPSMPQES